MTSDTLKPGPIFEAESLMNPSVGQVRYRAFCKCGWVSDFTDSKTSHKAEVAAHRAQCSLCQEAT